jgi:hypothetical protein
LTSGDRLPEHRKKYYRFAEAWEAPASAAADGEALVQENNRTQGRRRSLALGPGTLAAAGAVPRAAAAQGAGESRMETAMRRGRLIVATFGTAPPLCYTDERGQYVGFEIDLACQFAKGLFDDEGKIEFVRSPGACR